MLLMHVTDKRGRYRAAHRVFLAFVYLVAGLLVWDYITYYLAPFLASAEGMPVRRLLGVPLYILLFGTALAGAVVLVIASIMALVSMRWGTLCGLLGCLLELSWSAVGLRDLIVPHLPIFGYRIRYDMHFLRAEVVMIIASGFSIWTLIVARRKTSVPVK